LPGTGRAADGGAMKLRLVGLAATALIASGQPASAESITGRVVGVSDGDTLTVLTDHKRQVRVRLAGIDAPKRRQPFGTRARQALSALAFGRAARVEVDDIDGYGRTVGRAGRRPGRERRDAPEGRRLGVCAPQPRPLAGAAGGGGPLGAARPVGLAGRRARPALGVARREAGRTGAGTRAVSRAVLDHRRAPFAMRGPVR
jgi:hypothetical protein